MIRGAAPAGAGEERQAAEWVRGMFGRIAPRYDLLNHLLSLGIDRYWRRRAVARLAPLLLPDSRVLDLCCGTGDLLLSLEARRRSPVFGSDFSHPMLVRAAAKLRRRRMRSQLFESDALALPVAAGSLDLIAIAFGFRNLANYRQGLAEFRRALKPGGTLAVLEFSQPRNPAFAALYRFYSSRILPRVGGWISGSSDAYAYLPESVGRFPAPEQLAEEMRAAAFEQVRFERMSGGIVALHIAR